MRIEPAPRLLGRVKVPGDKSISHRLAILCSMAVGDSEIANYSTSRDCDSTLNCLAELGVGVERGEGGVRIGSGGWSRLERPHRILDAGNSGTTIRLLSAILAARPLVATIQGDESLNRRPMRRIMEPLRLMGARIRGREDQFPPLVIEGAPLRGIRYELPVASAQVKSCVLLAGLTASGRTTVVESVPTRDHTEKALPLFGVEPDFQGNGISVRGPQVLQPATVVVPGDISAAVYFVVASLLLSGSRIEVPGVGTNPTRSGLLRFLEAAGATINRSNPRFFGREPVCDLDVDGDTRFLQSFPPEMGGGIIPNIIDELPLLAVMATRMPRGLTVRDAAELRRKESDRITATVINLQRMGVPARELPDGFHVPFCPRVRGGEALTFDDHRIAMAMAVLGLWSEEGVTLDNPDCAAVSFPGFYDVLASVTVA